VTQDRSYEFGGETRSEFETRSALTFFSIVINCLHYTSPYRILSLRTMKGIGNREQRIRIPIYQKSCIVEYTVSDKLKFLFSVSYSLYLSLCAAPYIVLYYEKLIRIYSKIGTSSLSNLPWVSMVRQTYKKTLHRNLQQGSLTLWFYVRIRGSLGYFLS